MKNSSHRSELPVLLPNPHDVRKQFAVTTEHAAFIASCRLQICDILEGRDDRLLLICGPCSIHDVDEALEYAEKLSALSKEVSEYFFIVMRAYFDKARSSVGWQGFSSDPHLDGSEDTISGIELTRNLLLRLAEMKMPTGAELLNPISVHYFNDLLSWGCIGARTTESQVHRQLAASFSLPIGFKNNTSGNIDAAINGAIAASSPHTFMGLNSQGQLSTVRAKGNHLSHIVLRGGEKTTNYDSISINQALTGLREAGLPERVLIDCSHGNSERQHKQQRHVFQSVINQIQAGNRKIRGLILESHLNEGNQPIPRCRSELKYGISITDPCLDWDSTEQLIQWAKQNLQITADIV